MLDVYKVWEQPVSAATGDAGEILKLVLAVAPERLPVKLGHQFGLRAAGRFLMWFVQNWRAVLQIPPGEDERLHLLQAVGDAEPVVTGADATEHVALDLVDGIAEDD